ncbi:MAG: VWA domain-containing protein, partial [Planctomycetia bacterium]
MSAALAPLAAQAALLSRPGWAWALLLAPLAWWLLRVLERRAAARRRALLGPREQRLASAVPPRRRAAARLLFALGLALGLLALARPRLGGAAPVTAWRGMDLVVALDVSRSMLARDLAPDRLSRAARELEALAAAAEGDRLGLVLFAGEARVRVPLTRDRAAVARVAAGARPEDVLRGGTDLAAALDAAGSLVEGGAEARGAVLLLTDGEDHGGRGAEAAGRLRARGIAVHVLGVGSEQGARIAVPRAGLTPGAAGEDYLRDRAGREVLTRLSSATLARVAQAGGGTFTRLSGEAPVLPGLHAREVRPRARAEQAASTRSEPADRTPWLALAALLCFAADLLLRCAPTARAPTARAPTGQGAPALPAAPAHAAGRASHGHSRLPRSATALRLLGLGLGLALLPLLAGCGRMQEARELAAGGRHAEALALLEQELAAAGAAASPALHVNLGLCALRVGQPERARAAFAAAEAAGGPAYARYGAFLRGHLAFEASRDLEARAAQPGADPALFEGALMRAEDALAAWRLAARSVSDWPEARRNMERALLRLEALREQRRTGTPGAATPR